MLHQVLVSPLLGGAGLVAVRLAATARQRRVPCVTWVPGPGPAVNALQRENIVWRTYDLQGMRGATVAHVIACARMWRGLIARRPPIVHVHNPVAYRLIRPALVAARASVIVHFQIEPTVEEIQWALTFPPHHVVACARYMAKSIERVLEHSRVAVPVSAVPNAIDLNIFGPGVKSVARGRVGLSTDRPVVLLLANLAPHKGQATAIRAVHVLKQRGFPIECWLAGEDRSGKLEYEVQLRRLCADLAVQDEVRFLGFRSDAPDLLRAADVFVLPSTHEGLPLSMLEAQATHLPVIGSPIPGILEVIEEGVTGFIVAADDYATYADRIQMLIEQPQRRYQVGESGAAQVARDYGWSSFETRIFEIYRSLRPAAMGATSTPSS
jgi:glycosyltransferase involved in cell wall biosynthesis